MDGPYADRPRFISHATTGEFTWNPKTRAFGEPRGAQFRHCFSTRMLLQQFLDSLTHAPPVREAHRLGLDASSDDLPLLIIGGADVCVPWRGCRAGGEATKPGFSLTCTGLCTNITCLLTYSHILPAAARATPISSWPSKQELSLGWLRVVPSF